MTISKTSCYDCGKPSPHWYLLWWDRPMGRYRLRRDDQRGPYCRRCARKTRRQANRGIGKWQ